MTHIPPVCYKLKMFFNKMFFLWTRRLPVALFHWLPLAAIYLRSTPSAPTCGFRNIFKHRTFLSWHEKQTINRFSFICNNHNNGHQHGLRSARSSLMLFQFIPNVLFTRLGKPRVHGAGFGISPIRRNFPQNSLFSNFHFFMLLRFGTSASFKQTFYRKAFF